MAPREPDASNLLSKGAPETPLGQEVRYSCRVNCRTRGCLATGRGPRKRRHKEEIKAPCAQPAVFSGLYTGPARCSSLRRTSRRETAALRAPVPARRDSVEKPITSGLGTKVHRVSGQEERTGVCRASIRKAGCKNTWFCVLEMGECVGIILGNAPLHECKRGRVIGA